MEELFNLTYKDEVEQLKELDDFEQLGDEKYLEHPDVEARLYWAFCRPNGSRKEQISDSDPLVSIMAFNHSKLSALERFSLLHPSVIEKEHLRVKIKNRTRMLFRSLVDDDFSELNAVLTLAPVFLTVAVDQLKNGRKWNDIKADEIEATKFIERAKEYIDEEFKRALYLKLESFDEYELSKLKNFLEMILSKQAQIDSIILEHYKRSALKWLEHSDIHLLQKKGIERLLSKLT